MLYIFSQLAKCITKMVLSKEELPHKLLSVSYYIYWFEYWCFYQMEKTVPNPAHEAKVIIAQQMDIKDKIKVSLFYDRNPKRKCRSFVVSGL